MPASKSDGADERSLPSEESSRHSFSGEKDVHKTLQEAATMHGVSKSHLSRCVRRRKAAKGYYLRPYANIRKTGDGERIAGFTFPRGYEPYDSKVKEGRRPQTSRPNEEEAGPKAGPSSSDETTTEEISTQPAHPGARTEGETGGTDEGAQGRTSSGAGVTGALRKALAEERARREEAEEVADRAREEKEQWKELAQSREEDLRQRVRALAEVANHLKDELSRNQETITALQEKLSEWRESANSSLREETNARREAVDELYDRIEEAAEKRRKSFESLRGEIEEIAQKEEEERREAIQAIETRLKSRLGDLDERIEGMEGGLLEGLTDQLGEIGRRFQKVAESNPEQAKKAADLVVNLAVAYLAPHVVAEAPAQSGLQQAEKHRQQSDPGIEYGEWLVEQMQEEEAEGSKGGLPEDSPSEDDPPGESASSKGEEGDGQRPSGGQNRA